MSHEETEQELFGEGETFVADRLREAIETHRDQWQKVNGTNPDCARPDDLRLWGTLDA